MNMIDATKDYLRSSLVELRHVNWPSRKQTIRYTVIVISISVAFTVFFGVSDFGVTSALSAIVNRRPQQAVQESIPLESTPAIEATTPTGEPANIQVTPVETQSPKN